MALFEWSDLFAAGAGCDVAGAFLLARGLIVGPGDILRRSVTGEKFFSPAETASQISDKVDATLGLVTLGVGFVVQAGAYALVSGGVTSGKGGAAGAGVAVGVAVLAVVLALAFAHGCRWPLVRQVIVDIGEDPLRLGANYEITKEVESRPPSLFRLLPLAAEFGHRPRDGELPEDFAKRLFKIDQVWTQEDGLATAYRPGRFA
jgi:hypothetical protein